MVMTTQSQDDQDAQQGQKNDNRLVQILVALWGMVQSSLSTQVVMNGLL